jgi:hypothetical protein
VRNVDRLPPVNLSDWLVLVVLESRRDAMLSCNAKAHCPSITFAALSSHHHLNYSTPHPVAFIKFCVEILDK